MIQKYKKIIISAASVIAAVFGLLGGMWAFDSHYAKSIEVAELEVQVVESLKQYNVQQQQAQTIYQMKTDYKFYQFMYDKLTHDMYEIKRQLRRDPTDQDLRQDYINISNERQQVKNKMDSLMEKIK
jgi:hypothetical protein